MSRTQRIKNRNEKVRAFFSNLERKNPQWRLEALEKFTAEHFFIAERTVRAIIRKEGIYNE